MEILLVNPPIESAPSDVLDAPLGLGYLASVLLHKGHSVNALDLAVQPEPWQHLVATLESVRPDIVGITAVASTFSASLRIAHLCKQSNPLVVTIVGGVHTSLIKDQIQSPLPSIDYLVFGEGEITIVELVEALQEQVVPKMVPGIAYVQDNCLYKTRPRAFIRNLDTLPMPARHIFPMERYTQTHIMSSRGCPFHCLFCSSRDFWQGTVRFRSPEFFVDEIEHIVDTYGARKIFVADDTFTLHMQRAAQICDLIIERHLNARWSCLTRVDLLSEELLAKMARAGCETISLGCEVATQSELDRLQKNVTVQQIKYAIKACQRSGIATRTSWIVGFPWINYESIQAMTRLLEETMPDEVVLYTPVPYPGTKLYEFIGRYGVDLDALDASAFYSGRSVPLPISSKLKPQEISAYVSEIVERLVSLGYKKSHKAMSDDKIVTTAFTAIHSFHG